MSDSVDLQMSTSLTMHWIEIALEREKAAVTARRKAENMPTSEKGFGEALKDEMHASMVAVSASAHAIDALYGSITKMVELPSDVTEAWARKGGPSRPMRILETLKHGCHLGPNAAKWAKEFAWLFDLRDGALHHVERMDETVAHPTGKTHVSQEMGLYTLEAAQRAIDLAMKVCVTTIETTRPEQEPLHSWAEARGHVPGHWRELRPGLSETPSRLVRSG